MYQECCHINGMGNDPFVDFPAGCWLWGYTQPLQRFSSHLVSLLSWQDPGSFFPLALRVENVSATLKREMEEVRTAQDLSLPQSADWQSLETDEKVDPVEATCSVLTRCMKAPKSAQKSRQWECT